MEMGWRTGTLALTLMVWGCDSDGSGGETEGASSGAASATSGTSTTEPTLGTSTPDTPQTSSTTTPQPTTSASGTTTTGPGSESSTEGGSTTTTGEACANGVLDGDEVDVDCGGACGSCPTGSACGEPSDCESELCETGSCLGPADDCDLDGVQGQPGGLGWADSYSVDGQCYCASSFDHNIGDIMVDTPAGPRTVLEVCEAIGPGPGIGDNPIYNDIQCGNGPANDAGDEDWCPGRVDQGQAGCCTAGPTWDLSVFER